MGENKELFTNHEHTYYHPLCKGQDTRCDIAQKKNWCVSPSPIVFYRSTDFRNVGRNSLWGGDMGKIWQLHPMFDRALYALRLQSIISGESHHRKPCNNNKNTTENK